MKNKITAYDITLISILACFIIITGSIKIPIGLPGAEFQLSAPIAVAIAAVFGFKRYLIAGIIASIIMFLLGLHTIVNVEISMIFRITVGLILVIFGRRLPVVALAGPIGTATARYGLSLTLDVPFLALLIPTIPGMIITAIAAWPLKQLMERVYEKVGPKIYAKKPV